MIDGDNTHPYTSSHFVSGVNFGFRLKCDVFVQWIHGSLADGMSKRFEIGAGGTGGVGVEILFGPVVEEVWLAMRRFDNDEVEAFGVLAMAEEYRTIHKADGTTDDNNGIIVAFEHGAGASVLKIAPGFGWVTPTGEHFDNAF